jgi:vacuolar-type H+-ATPase subunit E/Vma4
LVGANRLYRQTALNAGEAGMASVLDQLERVLVEVANSPSEVSSKQLESLRKRIESQGILFKVRVVGSDVRKRAQRPPADAAPQQPAAQPRKTI